MANTTRKGSAKKKLISAIAMLTVSAVTLSTATYAWFTMSREVEVKNIQMTATTPEDIQLSFGAIGSPSEDNSLTKSGGYLTGAAPAVDTDWANIGDISHYYRFGKLIPASSTDGANVYFTADAAGVGRTMKTGAKFYQAAAGKTAYGTGTAAAVNGNDDASAVAHIITGADDKWKTGDTGDTYSASTAWNLTNDDGYYVDIPVWLRTSSSNDQTIYVYGYVCDKTEEGKSDNDDLYQAVRVAILSTSLSEGENPVESYAADKGCLTLKDGGDTIGTQDDAHRATLYPTHSDDANILDSYNYNLRASIATTPAPIYAVSGTGTSNAGAWATITQNNGAAGNDVVTLPAGNGATFGTAKKLIIRVWLEGEDANCWNENANQDWNISLKFTKDPLTANS
ncbi:hypothetical protein SAMN02910317_02005 [Ruminococcaceae bacterium FB2012]|nr:hypothetical protein SAMN02910317_02005 [Ruminococcaceae bacterium FB2012]